jgi:hypothetical protein
MVSNIKITSLVFFIFLLSSCDNKKIVINEKLINKDSSSIISECLVNDFHLIKSSDNNSVYVLIDNTKYPIVNWSWVDRCANQKVIKIIGIEEINTITTGLITYK